MDQFRGLGTMDFGLPAAMGACFARPDKTVICIDGDGSQSPRSIPRIQLTTRPAFRSRVAPVDIESD